MVNVRARLRFRVRVGAMSRASVSVRLGVMYNKIWGIWSYPTAHYRNSYD